MRKLDKILFVFLVVLIGSKNTLGTDSTETSTSTLSTSSSTELTTTETTESSTEDSTTTDESTSSSTELTTTETTSGNQFIIGRNDFSVRSQLIFSSSLRIFTRNLNIFGESFDSFTIYRNGFISLNQRANIPSIPRPSSSIRNFNFPIISPFWTNSLLDQNSDILYGFYSNVQNDINLFNSIYQLVNNQITRIQDSFFPEVIYSISWRNLYVMPDYRLTFQLFIIISNTHKKAITLFNYVDINWDRSIRENVFIGFSDGKSLRVTNSFSSNADSNGNPNSISNALGNTGKRGIYVYDIVYFELDQCSLWFNNELESGYIIPTRRLSFFFNCPAVEFLMFFNPFYNLYRGRKWQDARCYRLNSNVFFGRIIQQFCCYDSFSGSLILSGKDAGFAYDSRNIFNIISNGIECCSDNNWNQCRKFYNLYPSTLISRNPFNFFIGWGGGDPHITTFDGLSYTFNGLGKYVFSRSKKGMFEIQGETSILENQIGSASGTLFTSFAVKSSRSKIFQLDLINRNGNNPYFNLFIDRSNQYEPDFFRNLNFYKEYNCFENQNDTCTTIITSPESVQLIFDNGFSLNFAINTVTSNETLETISWISCSVNFLELNNENLFGDLEGLMGNFNQNSTDDIVGRDGQVPKDSSEREIYSVCETWKVLSSEDIFVPTLSPSLKARITGPYQPLFIDEIEIDPQVEENCKGNKQCIFDASASGILDFGLKTANDVGQVESVRENKDLSPPIIVFRENRTEINWYDNSSEIEITFEVIDTNQFNYTIQYFNISFIGESSENGLNTTITIRFKPIAQLIPVIGISATDETNLTSSLYYSNFFICNCQSFSTENICLFDLMSEALDTTAFLVRCECSDYYEGIYCENIRNGCGNGNPCNILSDFNQTCQPLEVEMQKSTNRSYECVGPCPSGYVNDENGACIDDLECERDPPACKDNSTCIEKIGSFECLCEKGSFYRNETCQKIDYCKTSKNNCDSICTSIDDGVVCSCYDGFNYNSSTNTCEQINTINDCECEQLCSVDTNGTIQCFCRNGFEPLNRTHCTDIKECQIDNGGCPETCIEKEGSFECSCRIGNQFNVETKNCEECKPDFFGVNCNQTCNCSINSVRCDPVEGCICNEGFEGLFCQNEIDACEGIEINDILTCESFYGQSRLSCRSGFKLINLSCVAMDLCIELNPCSIDANCISSDGTYKCECQSGFQYSSENYRCEDIQECLESVCEENSDCIELAGSYECDCKDGFVSLSSDKQKPNCVRQDLDPNQSTSKIENVSSSNSQTSFSSSSNLLSNSIILTSSPSSTSSSNLLSSSTSSSTFSSSSSTSFTTTISSSSSNTTTTNVSSLSSTSSITTLSTLSTLQTMASKSSTSDFSKSDNLTGMNTINSTLSFVSNVDLNELTTSTSQNLNTEKLTQSLLTKFRVILEKIIRLTLSRKRSLIVGDTNLTNLETQLIRLIPNSIFRGYSDSNDIFIDANITTELNDQTEISPFIQKVNVTLIDNENGLNEAVPSEFTLSIERDFDITVLRINEDGSEEVVDISESTEMNSNNSSTTNKTETISTTTLASSTNSAYILPYKIGLIFTGYLYFINLILIN